MVATSSDAGLIPQRGLGPQSSTVTTYDAQKKAWVWLSKPGGEPLAK